MEKLELKIEHLAPYLPYKLQMEFLNFPLGKHIRTLGLDCGHDFHFYLENNYVRPILRPLSDLFKLIDWDNNNEPYMIGYKYGIEKVNEDGIEFYANEYYAEYAETPKCYVDITSFDWWLFENHFDVFGLIEKGLAIDFNTLNARI